MKEEEWGRPCGGGVRERCVAPKALGLAAFYPAQSHWARVRCARALRRKRSHSVVRLSGLRLGRAWGFFYVWA